MGKSKRKLNRDRTKYNNAKENKAQEKIKRELQQKMMQLVENENYADALNVLAELIEKKIYDSESMYQGANCYFMLGDYERSIQWLNNTLQFEPNHVDARLLLARVCILEERAKDGLAIYDFILEHYLPALQPEQREDVADILEYYARNESDMIRQEFPYIARFMKLKDEAELSPAETSAQPADQIPIAGLEAADGTIQAEIVEDESVETKQDEEAVQQKIQQVQQMDASVMDKIHVLNVLAGASFCADDYAAAHEFLAAALKLDMHQDETLRNLAMLAHSMGEPEKALEYAAGMSSTDFVLLQALKSKG